MILLMQQQMKEATHFVEEQSCLEEGRVRSYQSLEDRGIDVAEATVSNATEEKLCGSRGTK